MTAAAAPPSHVCAAGGAEPLDAPEVFGMQNIAFERWFEMLNAADRGAIICSLLEYCSQTQLQQVGARVSQLLALPGGVAQAAAGGPGAVPGAMDRSFESFDSYELESGSAPVSVSSMGKAPRTPGLRPFRPMSNSSGSPFAHVIKPDLYTQPFIPPFSSRQQSFAPWSVSGEINRPKSATDTGSLPTQSSKGTFVSTYQNETWGPAQSAIGTPHKLNFEMMSSSFNGLPPVGTRGLDSSKRTWANPLAQAAAVPSSAPGQVPTSGAGSAPGAPTASAASTAHLEPSGSESQGPLRLGESSTNMTPSGSAGTGAKANGSTHISTNANTASGSSETKLGPTDHAASMTGSGGSDKRRPWNRVFTPTTNTTTTTATTTTAATATAPAATAGYSGQRITSPYSPKRAVNFMDQNLLQDIGAWLRSLRLHKYTENLSDIPWQEVVQLTDADLEARGVNALGARRKMLKMFEEIRAAQTAGQLPK